MLFTISKIKHLFHDLDSFEKAVETEQMTDNCYNFNIDKNVDGFKISFLQVPNNHESGTILNFERVQIQTVPKQI